MIYENKEQLQAACVRWQGVLRLRDWVIDARIVGATEMGDDRKAEVEYNIAERAAVVRVLDPVDYKRPEPHNHEVSLVHELLHVCLAGFDPLIKGDEMADVVLEQAVRSIAVPLVQMMDTIRAQAEQIDELSRRLTTDKQGEPSSSSDELPSSVV